MKNTKKLYLQYIAESFDCDVLDIPENSTPKEKAIKFLELVENTYGNNYQKTITEYLQGLGSGISIEYMNYAILEQAQEFGLIDQMMNNAKYSKYKNKELAKDRVEQQIIDNYWQVMASYIYQIAHTYKNFI